MEGAPASAVRGECAGPAGTPVRTTSRPDPGPGNHDPPAPDDPAVREAVTFILTTEFGIGWELTEEEEDGLELQIRAERDYGGETAPVCPLSAVCDPPRAVGGLPDVSDPAILPLPPGPARLIMAAADGYLTGSPVRAALLHRLGPTVRDYGDPKYAIR